ncbi:putative UPF0481 protein At3g02645 [Eucalyptus grandis]|uniref:putative UPF0481 protein At3g02645 n=1 Tax=Eucalyptus grandis TaxID=71139 RepID=UPI00192EC9E8|nr:putative UPF0481 protein At3g02645 [Eucalyptus grandis]
MSSSSTSIINASLSEEQWVKHIRDALNHGIDIETPVSVHRVPECISSAKPEAYVPHHVALGPYHHLRPQLYQTEHPKLAAARRAQAALKLPAFDRTAGLLQAEEAKIRASYQLHLQVGTDTLKWIMTIDSLFLLDLLYRYKSPAIGIKEDSIWDDDPDSTVKDVMMVENQIPTFVLRKIMLQTENSMNEVRENEEDESLDRKLGEMLTMFCRGISPLRLEMCFPSEAIQRKHLLDLLYNLILGTTGPEAAQTKKNELRSASFFRLIDMASTQTSKVTKAWNKLSKCSFMKKLKVLIKLFFNMVSTPASIVTAEWNELSKCSFMKKLKVSIKLFFNMVSIPASTVTTAWKELSKFSFMKDMKVELIFKIIQLAMQLIPRCSEYLSNDPFQEIVMIPTASKLCSVGIKLSLATGGIKTIAFDKKTATLKLPHIDLDATTEVLLRNLVAYEMISQRGSLILTRYTELMYGIIDTSEDLKLLREASIVLNRLNSDNKVVELFNGVIKSIGSKSTASELDETIRDVNEYYNSTRKVKVYNLMRKYVYSSWKFLTVVATVVLILLMVLQTFCSVLSCPRLFNKAFNKA